ncbi:DUF2723 domain-containing protein [Candidatus Woesearchaeota archaeon]|nr:DUF2723 domain-containing protein [Candidatus Woesearchaeota archaeon]
MKNKRYIIAAAVFFLSFAVYLSTLSRNIFWGDSAELVTVASTLGIAHSTGYPLYTLLGKLFTFIPFGSIAFRVNLMSAFFASLTAVLIFFISLKLTKSRSSSFIAAVMLGFSRVFWSQSVYAEVYTLLTFFISLLILVLVKWKETKNIRYLYLLSFLFGLSLTNHMLIILLILPFMYYILKTDKRVLDYRLIIIMFITFLIGLSVYAYLPLRSAQNPVIDWGNTEELGNFIDHVTASASRAQQRVIPFSKIIPETLNFLSLFVFQFTFVGFFIALLGMYQFYRKERKIFILLFGVILLNLLFKFYGYTVGDTPHYYLPSILVFSIFIARGLLNASRILRKYISSLTKITKNIASYFVFILFLLIPLLLVIGNFPFVDLSSFDTADRYVEYIFDEVEQDSILITKYNEDTFPIWYHQFVEGERTDINIVYFGTILSESKIVYLNDISGFFKEKYSTGFRASEHVYQFLKRNMDNFTIYTTPKNPILIQYYNNISFPLKKFEEKDLESLENFSKNYKWSSEI